MEGNRILIQGEEIAIDEKVSMEFYSPFIDNTQVLIGNNSINPRGKFSLPVTLKGNNKLNKLLGYLNLLSANQKKYKIEDVVLLSDGHKVEVGFIEVGKVSTNISTGNADYEMTTFFEQSKYSDLIEGKKVSNLKMSGIKMIWANPDNINLYPFNDFRSRSNLDIVMFLNPDLGYSYHFGDNYSTDTFDLLFNYQLFEDGLPPSTPSFTGSPIWTNPYPYRAIMSTNVWASEVMLGLHDNDYICFPNFSAKRGDAPISCNQWDEANNRFYAFRPADGNAVSNHCGNWVSFDNPIIPCYFYHKVLKHCFSEFGYVLKGDAFIDSEHFQKIYLQNLFSIIRESQMVILDDISSSGSLKDIPFIFQENSQLNPANHLPEMTIKEFLNDFMTKFCCRFVFNENEVSIEYNELEKIQREIKSYGNNIEFKYRNEHGLKLSFDTSSDTIYDELNNPLLGSFNGGSTEIKMKIPPVVNGVVTQNFATKDGDSINYYYGSRDIDTSIPRSNNEVCGQPTISYVYKFTGMYTDGSGQQHAPFEFIDVDEPDVIPNNGQFSPVGFYYGLMRFNPGTANDILYPYASWSNKLNEALPDIIGPFNLAIITDYGFIKLWWRLMVNVYACPDIETIDANELWPDIINHKYNQCVLFRGQQFYIASMKFDLPITQMPKYECYRIE